MYVHSYTSGPERFVEAATIIVNAISVRSVTIPSYIFFLGGGGGGGATFSTIAIVHWL